MKPPPRWGLVVLGSSWVLGAIVASKLFDDSGGLKKNGDGLWVFPKIVVPPNHPFVHRVFHYKPSIWGAPIFGNTHIIYLGGQRYQRCTPLAIWSLRVYLWFKKRGYEKSHNETPMPMDVENQSSLFRPDKATLPKINMEPEKQPFEKENHLGKPSFLGSSR